MSYHRRYSDHDTTWTTIFIAIALVAVWLVGACVAAGGSFSDPERAERVLTSMGYTNIETTGYQFWGCSEDDWIHTGFRAKGPTGIEVEGVVCNGIFFKDATVRFE